MKLISLWQPWASFMALELKRYETRHWATRYRGVIGIHAAKRWQKDQQYMLENLCKRHPELEQYAGYDFPRGCVLSAMRLTHIYKTEEVIAHLSPLEKALGDYSPGRFAWEMELIKLPEKPIPVKGEQGIWDWNPNKETSK